MGQVKTGIPGLQLKGNSYLIDKVVFGTRIYEYLGPVTLDDAQKILAKLVNAVIEGKCLPEKSLRSLTTLDILEYYWKEHLSNKDYANDVRFILDSVADRLGNILVINLNRADIERYKLQRLKDIKRNSTIITISPRTVEKELQHLSMSLNFAVDNRKITTNPIRRFIHVPQNMPKKIVLDDGEEYGPEWEAIYDNIVDSVKPIIVVLYESGMRPIEVFHMRWKWLVKKSSDRWIIEIPDVIDKTNYFHEAPVSIRLLAEFKSMRIRNNNSLVFPSPVTGEEITTIKTALNNSLIRSGLTGKGISPYAFRRTRLTIWDNIDSNASKYVSGHKFKEVHTKNYVKIPLKRLFNLVGLDYQPALRLLSKSA